MKSAEVVVLGGGVFGCATAHYLSKEGVKVTIVERDAVGSHASGFAFGSLNVYSGPGIPGPVFPLAKEACRMHKTLSPELQERTGIDPYYEKGIRLSLAFSEEDLKGMKSAIEWQQKEGLKAEIIDGDEVHRIEPRINEEAIGAALLGEWNGVEAYRFVLALMQSAEKMGTTLQHGTAVGIKRNGGRPSAVLLETGEIPCDTVVIAMGPWSGEVSQWLDFPVPVEPLKGQILRLQLDDEPLACGIAYREGHVGSKPDGLTWCGGTEEKVGFNETLTPEARAKVTESALKMVPALANGRVALQTACLRPMSPDLLPIVGPVPGWEGVYLATGAGRKGITLNPVVGSLLTDLIIRGETPWDISALLPSRFAPVKAS